MTTDQAQAQQAVNGAGPAPAAADGKPPCEDCATPGEKAMGAFGLLFAVAVAAIAIDLITGGAISRLAAGLFGGQGDNAGA